MIKCDICGNDATKNALLLTKTGYKIWANVCENHYNELAIKLPGAATTLNNIEQDNKKYYN